MKSQGNFHAPEHDWRYEAVALKAEQQETIENPTPMNETDTQQTASLRNEVLSIATT